MPAARNPSMLYSASLPFRVNPSGPLSTSSKIASNVDRPDRIKWPTSDLRNPYARIRQACTEDLHHRTPGPCQNGRDQFGDNNSGRWSEHGKRGAKREAHTQPADQYLRPIAGLNSLASNRRERFFGAAETAVHQFVVAQPDGEFGATLHETEFTASAGHLCHIEQRPGNHRIALPDVSRSGFWSHPQRVVYDNIKRRAIYNDAGERLAALRWLTREASKRRAAEFRALQWAMRCSWL